MHSPENIGSDRDNIPLSAPVRASLCTPKLIAGLEKRLFIFTLFVPLLVALILESWAGYMAAAIVFTAGWAFGRYLTRFDAYFFETLTHYLRRRSFYGYGESPSYQSRLGRRAF